jgi:hypothetical protein
MVDQHDRPRTRCENEKADSFWSAPRSTFSERNYVFCNTPDCSNNYVRHQLPPSRGYLLRQKADSFLSAVQCKKYGSLNRFSQRFLRTLALIILPCPTFSDRRRKKKADSFWSAPMSEKMRKFLGFLGACQEF